jgi:hypothetical protein
MDNSDAKLPNRPGETDAGATTGGWERSHEAPAGSPEVISTDFLSLSGTQARNIPCRISMPSLFLMFNHEDTPEGALHAGEVRKAAG